MKKRIFILLALLLTLVVTIGCSSSDDEPIVMLTHTYTAIEDDMLLKVNQYRVDHSLVPLEAVDHISGLCDQSNDYMISYNRLQHYYFQDRVDNLQRLGYTRVSEIVAGGFISNQSVLNSIISTSSTNSILSGDYTKIGISIKLNPANGKNFYTFLFVK